MAKKEKLEPQPRPELPPVINKPDGAKILLFVAGDAEVRSEDSQVVIERKS